MFELEPSGWTSIPSSWKAGRDIFQRRMQEFEERRRGGRGIFITREQIETSHAATVADLLRASGVRLNCRSGVV